MRGARIAARLERLAEHDLGQPARSRHAHGAAGAVVHQGRPAHDHRHAFLDARLRLAGDRVDHRVAEQQFLVGGDAAGAGDVGAQVELDRVGVAVGAGGGAAGAAVRAQIGAMCCG